MGYREVAPQEAEGAYLHCDPAKHILNFSPINDKLGEPGKRTTPNGEPSRGNGRFPGAMRASHMPASSRSDLPSISGRRPLPQKTQRGSLLQEHAGTRESDRD